MTPEYEQEIAANLERAEQSIKAAKDLAVKGYHDPGEKYEVILPGGKTLAEGTLDENGFGRVNENDPGNRKITIPNLDKDAWKKAEKRSLFVKGSATVMTSILPAARWIVDMPACGVVLGDPKLPATRTVLIGG